MSINRLRGRVPGAKFITIAALAKHSLRFHKDGCDGSAKCDAFFTGDVADTVWGVLFEMPHEQRHALDRAEGLGCGYDAKQVQVTSSAGNCYNSLTYYATLFNATLLPYCWYLNHVLIGAREAQLPHSYIAAIESMHTIIDPDCRRSQLEYAIHQRRAIRLLNYQTG